MALATSTALLIAAGAAAIGTGVQIQQGNMAKKSASSAAGAALDQQRDATKRLETAQAVASSQAQAALSARQRARAGAQSIFTSPLGISGTASVARKTLLGQ